MVLSDKGGKDLLFEGDSATEYLEKMGKRAAKPEDYLLPGQKLPPDIISERMYDPNVHPKGKGFIVRNIPYTANYSQSYIDSMPDYFYKQRGDTTSSLSKAKFWKTRRGAENYAREMAPAEVIELDKAGKRIPSWALAALGAGGAYGAFGSQEAQAAPFYLPRFVSKKASESLFRKAHEDVRPRAEKVASLMKRKYKTATPKQKRRIDKEINKVGALEEHGYLRNLEDYMQAAADAKAGKNMMFGDWYPDIPESELFHQRDVVRHKWGVARQHLIRTLGVETPEAIKARMWDRRSRRYLNFCLLYTSPSPRD